jgi:hypothetical protein
MREMQAARISSQVDDGEIVVMNVSKQIVPIHLRPPYIDNNKRADFFVGAQDLRLRPGQQFRIKKNRCWMGQIERLSKQRCIAVIADTQKTARKSEK